MIIWGSKGKEKVLANGQFFCPRCGGLRPYSHKRISKYFTLYFIPLFETQNLGEYIECQTCFTPFRVEVLKYSQSVQQDRRDKVELINKLTEELEAGLSIQDLIAAIKTRGVSEDIAAAMLYEITKGNFKVCDACGAFYISTLMHCSRCGSLLKPKSFS
jgi:hypothetical protein